MLPFLLVALSLIPGYLIPVLASLFFSLLMGRMAPEKLHSHGRIKTGFVVSHTVVWGLASVGSGYVIAAVCPEFKILACLLGAMLLIGALFSNVTLMKKKQSTAQFGGMVVATVLGIAAGLTVFLKTAPTA